MPTAGKKNEYQKLQGVKSGYCKGTKTREDVKAAKATYIEKTVAKAPEGKKKEARKDATAKANKVASGGCKMSSAVNGKGKGKK